MEFTPRTVAAVRSRAERIDEWSEAAMLRGCDWATAEFERRPEPPAAWPHTIGEATCRVLDLTDEPKVAAKLAEMVDAAARAEWSRRHAERRRV